MSPVNIVMRRSIRHGYQEHSDNVSKLPHHPMSVTFWQYLRNIFHHLVVKCFGIFLAFILFSSVSSQRWGWVEMVERTIQAWSPNPTAILQAAFPKENSGLGFSLFAPVFTDCLLLGLPSDSESGNQRKVFVFLTSVPFVCHLLS